MDPFSKWFILSFVLGIAGLSAVFFVETIARISGDLDRGILLSLLIAILIVCILSLFSIVKANSNRIRRELIASIFVAAIPLLALAINGFIFTVYFGGK